MKSIANLTVCDFFRAIYEPSYRAMYSLVKTNNLHISNPEFMRMYEYVCPMGGYSLTLIEIYNYIEKLTGFDVGKCRMLKEDMDILITSPFDLCEEDIKRQSALISWQGFEGVSDLEEFAMLSLRPVEYVESLLMSFAGTYYECAKEALQKLSNLDYRLKSILDKMTATKLLDDNYRPTEEMTKVQIKQFCRLVGVMLNLKHPWKTFAGIWGVKNLQQTKEVDGSPEKEKMITRLFPAEVIKETEAKFNIRLYR